MVNTPILAGICAVMLAGAMISMPQMIGLANAQSQQGLEHACPPGTTSFSQGKCVTTQVVGVPQCPPVTASPPGGPVERVESNDGTCTAVYLFGNEDNAPSCAAVGGTLIADANRCVGIPKVCDTGDLVDNQCVVTTTTRPGAGNQP